jgi:hypothetical protein
MDNPRENGLSKIDLSQGLQRVDGLRIAIKQPGGEIVAFTLCFSV